MSSIRFFLVAAIIAVIVLFNFIAAMHGYRSSMREAEILFDEHLVDSAKLIADFHANEKSFNLNYSSGLAFQVWNKDGELKGSSANAPQTMIDDINFGFSYANFSKHRWRTYSYENPDNYDLVIVAERADIRYVVADNVVLKSIAPIVLGIPFVGFLIWFLVGHGLKPLKQLSADLKSRQARDLKPLEQENTKNELKQLVQSTNELLQRVASAFDREKRFTADAAHELRTPMSVLKVQLHNLEQELPAKSKSVEQLQLGVERMQHLVEQLLSLYRTQPQEIISSFVRLNIHQLCQEVIADSYNTFETRQQVIELIADDEYIQGDRFALNTLLKNLLSNASKYTPREGYINVYVSTDRHCVYLKVEDSGEGISIEDRKKVFQRFYRLPQAQDSYSPGCGLGLTIVYHVAQIHKARVYIEDSGYKSGCTFVVAFHKDMVLSKV